MLKKKSLKKIVTEGNKRAGVWEAGEGWHVGSVRNSEWKGMRA